MTRSELPRVGGLPGNRVRRRRMPDARLEPITAHALWDRPVATKWVDERIAILGDAAHSMRPNLGQGACQSIHDAGGLLMQFAKLGLTSDALKAYEAVRWPYTQSIDEAACKLVFDPKAWKNTAQATGTRAGAPPPSGRSSSPRTSNSRH